jgi:hypothetical protein
MNGPKQTPNRRCGFCGEGLACNHGFCNVCQGCIDCEMGWDGEDESSDSVEKERAKR